MREQHAMQRTAAQRPTTDDPQIWKAYWKELGLPWRHAPEIDAERQHYLDERRSIVPDIEQGIYPFRHIKLTRADVEWLLATHEHGRGPIDWTDERALHEREGIDLRGADLRGVDLSYLSLSCMIGGLTQDERIRATAEQGEMAAVHLEGASLKRTRLEKAVLYKAHLERANFFRVHLLGANVVEAYLQQANLRQAHIQGSFLEGCILSDERGIGPWILNVNWERTDLAVMHWTQVKMLAEEYDARQKGHDHPWQDGDIYVGGRDTRTGLYERAVRANRQLAVALQTQGLNELAARFAYRAQKCQRIVLRLQRSYLQYLFSLLLDLLAGYGYRPIRTLLWYLLVVGIFAVAYTIFGHLPALPDALVFSLTSFHGRGFFPSLGIDITLHNPLVVMAAAEAVVGLFIEVSFIATFTKRFFGS